MNRQRTLFSREEMYLMNVEKLKERGVSIEQIAEIAYKQQSKWKPDISFNECLESVEKILSLRDVFHLLQLGAEIDRLTEQEAFLGPIQAIMASDLGMFGIDELFGLELAGLYGTIGKTNFGDIDVNKPGIVSRLNDAGKKNKGACHTFLDDIVGAIAAAASTRVAQIENELEARKDPSIIEQPKLF
ncbi:MAG: phosphatidylglycerophosphatase A [Candidatus Izemoplasmatales bacterium]|nr:phosphatidylglycerophosphatase A [Candidatus Izemoplasmatales bacterium]MDD4988329.1 phosphatidylglycerophosphatase A [Candidatus Izemoplasmatales bacterium]MDD5602400.1 phosphatidylglycerophosphatase A [Candidatus Izemoplasmatales bacterium]MDY0372918.1 phosphatidylglycerophosphatase A [Candidatus Izemoplasmatales bacterium]